MLGLIIKDFIQLKRILKTLVGIAIIYTVLAFLQGSSEMFATLGIMICVISCINSLALDEHSKWNQYALTLPFTRTHLVVSKYIMAFILASGMTIVCMLVELAVSQSFIKVLEVGVGSIVGSIISVTLLLPFIYKFGIERGRYVLMAVVMFPFVLALLGKEAGIEISVPFLAGMVQTIEHAPWILAVGAILFAACSLLISIWICKKKEY